MDNIESLSALPILYTSKGKRAVGRYLTEITPSLFQQYKPYNVSRVFLESV